MMRYLSFLFLFLCFYILKSQSLSGVVLTDDSSIIRNVQVINLSSNSKSITNDKGEFQLLSKKGDEIRFVKEGFERQSYIVQENSFAEKLIIVLKKEEQLIPELEIKYQATGNLFKDHSKFGESKRVTETKIDLDKYLKSESTLEVNMPNPGEFKQPNYGGISLGAVEYKWDDFKLQNEIIKALGKDYFIIDLGLQEGQIGPFIFAIFKNFPRKNILKYGRMDLKDLMRFQLEAEKILQHFVTPTE